ncbi:hypothetical protein AGLY_014434 [Aphis glycines]|uniref:Uncharacterized protein n=1 Tax=Aphis glycines TaxID=307491 RepID=A0A6G0T3G5_APHGL|nr:hypothetical protein AGLY_014434 [Aphis glycines]
MYTNVSMTTTTVSCNWFQRNFIIQRVQHEIMIYIKKVSSSKKVIVCKYLLFARLLENSERSDECIDFTMIRNNALISNFKSGFRWKNEYPWCIIQVKMTIKKFWMTKQTLKFSHNNEHQDNNQDMSSDWLYTNITTMQYYTNLNSKIIRYYVQFCGITPLNLEILFDNLKLFRWYVVGYVRFDFITSKCRIVTLFVKKINK